MLVVEVDVVDAEPPKRFLAAPLHVGGVAARAHAAFVEHDAELGRQHHPVPPVRDGSADELLVRAVDVGRVEQRHADGQAPGEW